MVDIKEKYCPNEKSCRQNNYVGICIKGTIQKVGENYEIDEPMCILYTAREMMDDFKNKLTGGLHSFSF